MHGETSPSWTRNLFKWATLACSLGSAAWSQQPPTIREALERRHIVLTTAALIEALHDSDKVIRGLAAGELAERKVTGALPEILRAAQGERDPQTKVNIASAATWMGSEEGMRMLKVACTNRSYSSWVRLGAARGVFDRGDHGCFAALLEMVQTGDRGARLEALSAISQVHDMDEQETKTVVSLAVGALRDNDVGVRLAACEALGRTHGAEAIAGLRQAMLTEKEGIVRSEMEASWKHLLNSGPAP